jgi:hypothetical protein
MRSPATSWLCAALLAILATSATATALTCPTSVSTAAIRCFTGEAVTAAPTSAAGHPAGLCGCWCMCSNNNEAPTWDLALAAATENSCVSNTCDAGYAAATAPSGCTGCATDYGYSSGYSTWEDYTTTQGPPKASTFPAGSICYQYTTTCNAAAVAARMCPSTLLGFATTKYNAFNSAESSALAQCATLVPLLSSVQITASACATNNCNQPPASAMAAIYPSGAATAAGTVAALLAASVAALAMM